MWASAEKSYDTLPPNSYDKLSVIQLYFRSLPADISIFDKWIKEEIGSHTMKKGTEEDLKKLLQEEFEKIGKIKLLNIKNDKYEVVDEGIISGFDSNNDKITGLKNIINNLLAYEPDSSNIRENNPIILQ